MSELNERISSLPIVLQGEVREQACSELRDLVFYLADAFGHVILLRLEYFCHIDSRHSSHEFVRKSNASVTCDVSDTL